MMAVYMQAAPQPAGNLGWVLIVGIVLIFYLLLILPVQRQKKKTAQMQAALKPGDRVVTSAGLRGVVISVKDDAVQLRVPPDQVKLEFMRSAVQHVIAEDAAK